MAAICTIIRVFYNLWIYIYDSWNFQIHCRLAGLCRLVFPNERAVRISTAFGSMHLGWLWLLRSKNLIKKSALDISISLIIWYSNFTLNVRFISPVCKSLNNSTNLAPLFIFFLKLPFCNFKIVVMIFVM